MATFNAPELNASICGFSIRLPKFSISFLLPAIAFPPKLPIPRFSLQLTCDPSNPINVSAGLGYGGGRVSRTDPDPDTTDT
jgi:hypothetical protein